MLLATGLYAQSKVDSLQANLRNATDASIKINILNELFEQYKNSSPLLAKQTILKVIKLAHEIKDERQEILSSNQLANLIMTQVHPDSAIVIFQNNLELSKNISFQKGELQALLGIGTSHWRKGDFITAERYQKEHIELAESVNDRASIAASYKLLASIYTETANYTNAMQYFILASQEYRELGMLLDFAGTLDNIGFVQRRLENYESAKNYFLRSDSLYYRLNHQPGRANVQYNIAVIYKNTGDLDKAHFHNQIALEIYERLGDLKRMGYAQYTMGSIFSKKENYNEALKHYKKAINYSEKAGDSINMAYTFSAIGNDYLKLKMNEKARESYLKTVDMAYAKGHELMALEAYQSLSKIYISERNYAKAYESINRYSVLKDSLYTKEKRELASEIEAKYQNDQKEKEIALLSTEKNLQSLQLEKRVNERNAIIALAFIMLLMAGLLYNQFRIKQNANKKLQEVDRLKSNFFANISHEFRTPLTLIKGPIEQLEHNPKEKLSRENIKMIRRNTDRVLTLVNQLLDLSKIDGGSLKLEAQEGEIFQFLRAVTSSFSSHAAHRNVAYRVQIPQSEFLTVFDRDKVEKVMNNLLSNAFKFSESGTLVSVDISCDGRGVQMQVADTGKGVPKEKLPFIFDRFYQVDSSATKEKEGSGIGLSLTKDLVQLMNGTIKVSSEIEKGTVFTVHLPLIEIRTSAQEKHEYSTTHKPSIVAKNDPGAGLFHLEKADNRDLPEILLIEDNADMRQYIKEHLIDSYRVRESINGQAGLEKALAYSPDLIITDWMMPKMNGMELCKKLKSDIHTSHIPVIMLTAKAGMHNKLEGLETGADDYLTKPFDGKELLVRSKNLIQQRQKFRELFSVKEVKVDPKKITVNSVDQRFLEKVLALLEDNFPNPDFGVPQMQHALAMSKTQLHRKLKALTSEAPGELLRNFRLKRAAQLLSQKADSVTQIAYKVGFNNLSYFAKCFKELYGVTPSAY